MLACLDNWFERARRRNSPSERREPIERTEMEHEQLDQGVGSSISLPIIIAGVVAYVSCLDGVIEVDAIIDNIIGSIRRVRMPLEGIESPSTFEVVPDIPV